jgi:hypothetical protein
MSILTNIKNFIKNEVTFTSFMKYIVLILIYALILTSNLYTGFIIKNRLRKNGVGKCFENPVKDEYRGLPDILHFDNEKINDAAATISNITLVVSVLFLFICFLPNNVRNLKLIFLFTTLAVVGYIIRVVAFAVTVPPPPVQQHEDEYDNIIEKIMKEGDPRAAVSDFMFSGHAFFIVLSMLFIWNYRKISDTFYLSPKLFYIIYALLAILGLITIPAISLSRLHYSSDVVIGTSIAVLLFLSRNHFALKLDYQELI